MEPVKVLAINGGPLDYGGISTHIVSYLGRMDPAHVRVDIAVHGNAIGPREAEAEALGARIFHVPNKREDYRGNVSALTKLFSSGEYPIVHAHLDGMNGFVLNLAKRAGVPYRISHCHNTGYLTTNPLRILLHTVTKRRIPTVATHLMACSEAAGRFFYGDRLVEEGRLTVVKNAVELDDFRFCENDRERLRRQMHIPDGAFVIGHVGRFEHQKNHAFLLSAFAEAYKRRKDAVLVLCGDGVLREQIEQSVKSLGIADAVRILGYRSDVHRLYSSFDMFALPSRFEGLGIVLVEAQMSGLSCIASDAVPKDTDIRSCAYLPLSVPVWAEAMLRAQKRSREVDKSAFVAAGYDIGAEAERMESFYGSLVKTHG